jgi:leucyl aminopeptidase
MGAFMSVAKGSSEEPWLLELHYNSPSEGREERGVSGEEGKPTVLVGKGTN